MGAGVGTGEKELFRLISGKADRNFRFAELTKILERLGFSCRIRGAYFIFTHPEIDEIANDQKVTWRMAG